MQLPTATASYRSDMSDLLTETGAKFSDCKRYRYRLWRYWNRTKPALCFLMLNPSTADDLSNDPTVERCQRRAQSMGFGGLEVANIFAFRSTDPWLLYSIADPVGPGNDQAILDACADAGMVICGWGDHGKLNGRGDAVRNLLSKAGITTHALKQNSSGEPKHPLYVSYKTEPMPWGKES